MTANKAQQHGTADAQTFLNENPRETWTGAAGREGADEALINALGVEAAGKLLGVERPTENGETTAEALAAFGEYAAAFRARIADELRTVNA